MEQQPIIEGHGHLVIYEGDGFPNKALNKLSKTKPGFFVVDKVLRYIDPFTPNDKYDKLANFVESNKIKDWRKKFLMWRKEGQWSDRTKMVVLTVNMAHMGAGKPDKTFGEACAELERLRQEFPDNILAFFHYDCRSGNAYDLFKYYVIGAPDDPNSGQWAGVKFYSSMGVFPQDSRYKQMYEDLQRVGKPIIAHCTYSNPIHFLGKEKELKQLLGDRYDPKASRKENCDKFTDPRNIFEVARQYPGIKFDLAHWGGQDQWRAWAKDNTNPNNLVNVIIEGMKELPNIYADTSFTMNDKELWPIHNRLFYHDDYDWLKDRMLFGTDWDMTKSEIDLKQYTDNFRFAIGENVFNKIARENNHTFLYGNLGCNNR